MGGGPQSPSLGRWGIGSRGRANRNALPLVVLGGCGGLFLTSRIVPHIIRPALGQYIKVSPRSQEKERGSYCIIFFFGNKANNVIWGTVQYSTYFFEGEYGDIFVLFQPVQYSAVNASLEKGILCDALLLHCFPQGTIINHRHHHPAYHS